MNLYMPSIAVSWKTVVRSIVTAALAIQTTTAFANSQQPPAIFLDSSNPGCIFSINGLSYNLSSVFLTPFFNATLSEDFHAPTLDVVNLYGSPCSVMTVDQSKPSEDQCPTNTRFCEITTNWKHADARITNVRQYVAGDAAIAATTAISDGISLSYNGLNETMVILNIHCKKEIVAPSEPRVVIDLKQIQLNWDHAGGCGTSIPTGSSPGSSSMSTTGFFFTILFAGLFGYFIIGMAYNYSVLKISNFPDILPHHELWTALALNTMDFFAFLRNKLTGSFGGNNYVSL
ncbi:type II membrane protein [Batrachochytrium dendrobatidis]|nr:type II membrane protein [Batrachochytrium dendrobatidis]KAK5671994.1 type II membrane protein [Batrachochytrium dendrobatidis]